MTNSRLVLLTVFLLALLAYSGCGDSEAPLKVSTAQTAQNQPAPANGQIRLAIASVISPNQAFKYYEEMIDYLSAKTGRSIRLIQRENYREVNDLMKLGDIDVAFVCSGAYVDGADDFGMELLVAPQMAGQTVYYSYIITTDQKAKSLKDLKDKTFAFTDPLSNSGYLSPTYILKKEMNDTPSHFFREVKFTYSHDVSVKAVAQGKVDAAAVDSLIYDYLGKTEPELVNRIKVVNRSEPYGIPPVVVHPKLLASQKKSLQDVFLNMHQDPKGRAILERLSIDKFVIVADNLYDSVRQMSKALK